MLHFQPNYHLDYKKAIDWPSVKKIQLRLGYKLRSQNYVTAMLPGGYCSACALPSNLIQGFDTTFPRCAFRKPVTLAKYDKLKIIPLKTLCV